MELKQVQPIRTKITKLILVPLSPLQYILDHPGMVHQYSLDNAFEVLHNDGRPDIANYFKWFKSHLTKGLFWADRGWKNVCHYYSHIDKPGILRWPGAVSEFQYNFNKAIGYYHFDICKSMFYLGAALHILQDMCVPHHAVGAVFDGHQEFEAWATMNYEEFTINRGGRYLKFEHPHHWIKYNAEISANLFPLVSLSKDADTTSFREACETLIPLTIQTTAGFLDFTKKYLDNHKE